MSETSLWSQAEEVHPPASSPSFQANCMSLGKSQIFSLKLGTGLCSVGFVQLCHSYSMFSLLSALVNKDKDDSVPECQ
jgi:hypothetical protein